jgi:hypothetical protein
VYHGRLMLPALVLLLCAVVGASNSSEEVASARPVAPPAPVVVPLEFAMLMLGERARPVPSAAPAETAPVEPAPVEPEGVRLASPEAVEAPLPAPHALPGAVALPLAIEGETLTPAEPGYHGPRLTSRQLYGLALYVTDDEAFATFAVGCWPGESGRGGLFYVGAVNRNPDGSLDHGIGQQNDVWAVVGVDLERVRRDPVYAMQALYRTYQVQGAGAWFGCAR